MSTQANAIYGSLGDDQVARLRRDPRRYMMATWRHPTDPSRRYDFYDTNRENRLAYLVDDDGPLNPRNWGNINVLKFARGCLKTTSVTGIASWAHQMFLPWGIRGYMTAPREKPPITGFMRQFDTVVRQTGLDQFRTKDNQFEQRFEVQVSDADGTYPVTSVLEADSGYNPDTLRGPHSHYGIIDEFQDIGKPAFDTYSQCIDQKLPCVDYFPAIFIIGTPKYTSDFYHELWQQTDQRHWDSETGEWVAHSEATEYVPDDYDGADDAEAHTIRGWHIDHYDSPLHSEADIARDSANLSAQKFANEVEAQFYDPEDNLLGREDVIDTLFDHGQSGAASARGIDDGAFVTCGVDWGGGGDAKAADTVVAVCSHQTIGDEVHTTVHDIDLVDTELTANEEVRRVESALTEYQADRAVVDHGHGYHALESLQDGDGTRDPDGYDEVVGCRFGNIKDKSDVKFETNSGQRRFFTVDKTNMVERAVRGWKAGHWTIPVSGVSESDRETVVSHLTAPYKDYTTTVGGQKKLRVQTDDTRQDDVFDALVYNYLAYHEVGPMTMPSTVQMSTRRGV